MTPSELTDPSYWPLLSLLSRSPFYSETVAEIKPRTRQILSFWITGAISPTVGLIHTPELPLPQPRQSELPVAISWVNLTSFS